MAKRESSINNGSTGGKSRVKPKGKSFLGRLVHFIVSPLVWRFILLVIIVAILFWQWDRLASWITDVTESTVGLFGWGLVLIAIAIITIMGMIWRRQLSVLAHRWKLHQWNKWVGATAFILAVWGILALFDLGGSFGMIIIGQQDFVGILRILGLVILGLILVAPKACFHLVVNFTSWTGRQFKRQPITRTVPQSTLAPAPLVEPPQLSKPEPEKETTPVPRAPAPAQPQQELRQVAQDVWRKYGESPALVTINGWRLPPIDILDKASEIEFEQADNSQRARLIEEALASYGVESKVVQINAGPTVTQFGIEPGWDRKMKETKERDRDGNVSVKREEISKTRVKVERITSLANDLALALAAPSIRIEAPVPGKSVVGVEVPNVISSMVDLRGVIETSSFQKIETRSKLSLALGKGAGGEAVSADLSRMPHLLIAGATGSGKTVCLNTVISCLLMHNVPNEVQFIMIDPKRVELTPFNSIPHLATPVIVDTSKAVGTLRWLNQEMDKRYQQLATAGARNIVGYNKNKQGEERLPYLILIIDELADLMMAGFDEVEHILCRLAQLARAIGIHLVVATQRPSVDVVTGLIKANFPTRISFAVTSQVDSRTILDGAGAEKLLGKGDMLYMPTEAAKPTRLQGCFVSDAEIERLVYFWSSQRKEEVTQLKIEELTSPVTTSKRESFPEDPLLESAKQLLEEHKHISTSYLQRKLRIGYPRAARIMEQLEEKNPDKEESDPLSL
ncbi:DNA translocase FtsK [Chloroflexota bacterium]